MGIKVSAIVPVYNAERYIMECAESLVRQTLAEIEIIFVNDASTDESEKLLEKYVENYSDKVKLVSLERNSKQGAARNIGVKQSNGEYIMFVDSDDYLDTDACKAMYEKAVNNDADIVFCDYEEISIETTKYKHHISQAYVGELNKEKKRLLLTTSVVPWAKLIRKSLILENDIWFPEGKSYEDQATTYLYYLYAKKAEYVARAYYKYRVTSISTSTQKNQTRHFEALEMAQLLIERIKKRGFLDEYYPEIEYFAIEQMYCLGILNIYSLFTEPQIDHMEKLLWTLNKEFPNYTENYYYKYCLSQKYKKILQLHQVSIDKLIGFLNCKNIDSLCPNYTYNLLECRVQLEHIKGYLAEKKCHLALWGAGKFGVNVIKAFQEVDLFFDKLYDNNSALQGKDYEYLKVEQYAKKEEYEVIIVPFMDWICDVISRVRTDYVEVIDLETYIKTERVFIDRK